MRKENGRCEGRSYKIWESMGEHGERCTSLRWPRCTRAGKYEWPGSPAVATSTSTSTNTSTSTSRAFNLSSVSGFALAGASKNLRDKGDSSPGIGCRTLLPLHELYKNMPETNKCLPRRVCPCPQLPCFHPRTRWPANSLSPPAPRGAFLTSHWSDEPFSPALLSSEWVSE